MVQLATPGDRIVVLYGSGHAVLLRQCVRQMPGFRLVEGNDYLPWGGPGPLGRRRADRERPDGLRPRRNVLIP